MKVILSIVFILIVTVSLAQDAKEIRNFFDVLDKLPKSYLAYLSVEEIKDKYLTTELDESNKNNYYDFNQPYSNLEISYDSLENNYIAFIDTATKLLIVDNQLKKASLKIFNDTYPYLIGYSLSRDEHIAYGPIQTTFWQLHKNGELKDITEQLFENLEFCKDNYWDKTISYFKGTSKEIKCDPAKLLFNFTETDTIWIMNCHYDIFEEYNIDTLFDNKCVKDVYIARKYIMDNGKLRLVE